MEIEIKEKIDSLEIIRSCKQESKESYYHSYFYNAFDLFLIHI